jgi:hypothetical protein
MGDGAAVKKIYRSDGHMDKEVVTGTKNATNVPDVHKEATEEKVIPIPTPADPERFDGEPRQG